MKNIKNCILLLLIALSCNKAFAQYKEEQISFFSSRVRNPIEIQVIKKDQELTFHAYNTSLFPYEVIIEFSTYTNLTPVMSRSKNVVHPGENRLFSISVYDKYASYNYSYDIKYSIGAPNKKIDANFPYFIPLGEGKEIKLLEGNFNSAISPQHIFQISKGDTIFNMRKGIVSATPGSDNNLDKITGLNSIEILHNDGSVAAYNTFSTGDILVKPGQKVYPLQPLAIVKDKGWLTARLFQFEGNGKVKEVTIMYEADLSNLNKTSNTYVKHKKDNIEKELTKREKKKLSNGEFYK